MSSDQQNQADFDPSIYQYDEVYDQIKADKKQQKKTQQSISHNRKNPQDRQRSREKQTTHNKPSGSRYIKKMKQSVEERQRAHQYAREKKIERENQKLGVKAQEVFVTESYLKKKREEKQRENKQKQKQKYDQEHSILNKKKNVHDFTRKLLDQSSRKY